jgi:flagellar biosynthetic protein FliO
MSDGSAVLTLLRMVVSLAAVLGLLYVLVRYAQRRQGGGALLRKRPAAHIQVLGRTSLSRAASVHVVQVAARVLVLGVSDGGVRVLTELDPDTLTEGDAAATVRGSTVRGVTARGVTARGVTAGAAAPQDGDAPEAFRDLVLRAAASQGTQTARVVAQVVGRRGKHRG